MNWTSLFLIALALAMDAFAVAIATGIWLKCVNHRQRFRLSWHFGLFQSLMAIAGWFLGKSIVTWIEKYDHWVAFLLLAVVGGHMIGAFFQTQETAQPKKDPTKGYTLILLSTSTSLDALAVGLSLSLLGNPIGLASIVIGIIALVLTLAGLEIGARMSHHSKLSPYAQLMGGLILLLIGLHILYQHGVFDSLRPGG